MKDKLNGRVRGGTIILYHTNTRARERMDDELFEITADMVTVEVTDRNTGRIFRRELPIDYFENANFLRLSGENLDGSVSQLVFYTARGVERMKDLTGKGPNYDPCGGHSH